MTNTEVDVKVLEVACLTEDRSPQEQRALLTFALRLDRHRGAFIATNDDLYPPTLVAHVEATYDPSTGKPVSLTNVQREKYNRLLGAWSRCAQCGQPQGIHYGNDDPELNCPRDDDYFVLYRSTALDAWRAAGQPVDA